MGALLDAATDGGYGDNSDYGDSSTGSYTSAPAGTNYAAGIFQSLTALGTGYLSKRMDIDLSARVAGAMAYPGLRSTQNPVNAYGQVVRTPNGQQVAQLNLSALMPLALVAVVAFLVARRGG